MFECEFRNESHLSFLGGLSPFALGTAQATLQRNGIVLIMFKADGGITLALGLPCFREIFFPDRTGFE